ncbi:hypothetical protein B0T16DRAFT_428714 [Cercophora newfieldiana]|uniref:Uncharacterized protein n=1 Tax=Cercophora newfieldiana TaxID=92897 RepID=A0AA39Y414_9PEZI|nr:hypothetical protein B0T16DRAFT_428714 [Cercophora newfieldiana]
MGSRSFPAAPVPAHLAEHEDDENGWQTGYVKGTDFSLPYYSPFSRMHGDEVASGALRHINCGYLSTPGVAPTLLALKQHAQSLCLLIQAIDPTEDSREILQGTEKGKDKEKPKDKSKSTSKKKTKSPVTDEPPEADSSPSYTLNDAFDFLTDLTTPYTNDDPSHHKPLTMLLNEVRSRHEGHGLTTYHCPFHAAGPPRAKAAPQKPYATHHNLVMHANACLERLDHEFSSTGGILSLLPTRAAHDADSLAQAQNSLLGQWLLFTQTLVARTHELERAYGNALDVLAGEAAIPAQSLSEKGPDGRSGREVAYPQDKYILVNAGEDAFKHIHHLLDKQEALVQQREKGYKAAGVLGDYVWAKKRDGSYYARGLVPVNITTRYYRIMGQGHGTLFVVPAWGTLPAVGYTRELEGKPAVVATPMVVFPERVSELERKFKEGEKEVNEIMGDYAKLKTANEKMAEELETLRADKKKLEDEKRKLKDEMAEVLKVTISGQRSW